MSATPTPLSLAAAAIEDAKRATPGPWVARHYGKCDGDNVAAFIDCESWTGPKRRGHPTCIGGTVAQVSWGGAGEGFSSLENANFIANARTSLPILASALLEASARIAKLEAALNDAVRVWTFSDGQHPTHSWHDREDWYARHEVAREARKAALSSAPRAEEGKP